MTNIKICGLTAALLTVVILAGCAASDLSSNNESTTTATASQSKQTVTEVETSTPELVNESEESKDNTEPSEETTTTTAAPDEPEDKQLPDDSVKVVKDDFAGLCELAQLMKGKPLSDAAELLEKGLDVSFGYKTGIASADGSTAMVLFIDKEATAFPLLGGNMVSAEIYYDESGVYALAFRNNSNYKREDIEAASVRPLAFDSIEQFESLCVEIMRAYKQLDVGDKDNIEEPADLKKEEGSLHFQMADTSYAANITAEAFNDADDGETLDENDISEHMVCSFRIDM